MQLEKLSYDSITGKFVWKKHANWNAHVGKSAGCVNKRGYVVITLNGKQYYAHRLAWLIIFGVDAKLIDHINGDKQDNRICNLRNVSHIENGQNQFKAQKDSKSGYLGVTKIGDKYQARIVVNGKRVSLGYFNSPQEASNAYKSSKRINHI